MDVHFFDLKRGLDRAARAAIDALRSQPRPVQSGREKQQIATISAHNDATIRELVAGAIEKVGAEIDGGVVVEKTPSGTGNCGFDAAAGQYVDLGKAGTIDPTRPYAWHWRMPYLWPVPCC